MGLYRATIAAFIGAATSLTALPVWAGETLQYGAPPSWADVAPIPDAPAASDQPHVTLLRDVQTRFEGAGDVTYFRRVVKILKPEGLRAQSNFSRTWQPDRQTLTMNTLQIRRGDQVIDLLPAKDLTVLRREKNLEAAILDGALTATKQIEGLQVGDILEISSTLEDLDPVRRGKSDITSGVGEPVAISRQRIRFLWPESQPMTWRKNDGMPDPVLTKSGGMNELVFDIPQAKALIMPANLPARFARYQTMAITEFKDWNEISALMAPHYAAAMAIKPGSPLAAETARIKAATRDPKQRAAMALNVVQEQVRYFLLAMGDGGYVPASAEETWTRRFGDCKGKTVLLLAMLKDMGINADPVIVATQGSDGLETRLPRLGEFNHVLVRANIGGKVYWMDGTRRGEVGDLDDLPRFPFLWALPVTAKGATIERVDRTPRTLAQNETHTLIDLSAGADAPVRIVITMTGRGDTAIATRATLVGQAKDRALQSLQQNMEKTFPQSSFTIDWRSKDNGDLVITGTGSGPLNWREDPETKVREFQAGSITALRPFPQRSPGPLADAPYTVAYPVAAAEAVEFILPGDGSGFKAFGPNADETVGGQTVLCKESRDKTRVAFECKVHSIVAELTAAEVKAAEPRIRAIQQQRVILRRAPAA